MERLNPCRGDVWMVDLGDPQGHEQGGRRPAVVVSVNALNLGHAELAIVVPLTSRPKRSRFRVEVSPPEGGLTKASLAKCEDIRSVSHARFDQRLGVVSQSTLARIEYQLRAFLGL